MSVIGKKVRVVGDVHVITDEHGNPHNVGGQDKGKVGVAVDWMDQRKEGVPEDRRWLLVGWFEDCTPEEFAPMAERHAWGHDHAHFRPCDLVDDKTGKPVDKAPW